MKKLFLMPVLSLCLVFGACYSDNDEPQLPKEEEAVVLTQEMLKGYLEGNLFKLQNAVPLHYVGGGKWEEISLIMPGVGTVIDRFKVRPHTILWSRDGELYLEYFYTYFKLHDMFAETVGGFSDFNRYMEQNNNFGYPYFVVAKGFSYDAETKQLSTDNLALELEDDENVLYIVESCDADRLVIRVEYGETWYQGHNGVRFTYVKTDEVPEQHRDFNSRDEFKEWFDKLIEDWKEADSSTL